VGEGEGIGDRERIGTMSPEHGNQDGPELGTPSTDMVPSRALDDLGLLVELANAAGVEPLAAETATLANRFNEGRFFVACLGQFKRGKSTVLNALVGCPLLPTGVIPVTSVVTVLRHGPSPPRAVVHFTDGRTSELATFDLAH
jgi:hypothetical protein